MTTTRVTVPVEPTERLAQYVKGTSPYRAWRGVPPEGEPTLKSDIAAMLSAAPAPEGGAEWFGVTGAADETEALAVALFDARCPGIRMTEEDMHYYRAAAQRAMQAVEDELDTPALATREEAPAEAGESLHPHAQPFEQYPELALHIERMAMSGVVGSMISWDAFLRELNAALRAQPPAREDAQPVWVDGVPTKHHAKEWFIAETTFGDRVVLTALPEEYAYDFKTADETYIKADRIKRWMPFPDSQYLFPHPAPDALRVAVEALAEARSELEEYERQLTGETYNNLKLNSALAALQAEQGAK